MSGFRPAGRAEDLVAAARPPALRPLADPGAGPDPPELARDGLGAIEAGLHEACARVVRGADLGALVWYRIPAEHPFLRSVALPGTSPATVSRAGVASALEALRALARAAGCPARVELVAERRAGLRPALAAAGFVATLRAPLLAGRAWPVAATANAEPTFAPAAPAPRISLVALSPDAPEALLDAVLEHQHAVLGEHPPSAAERTAWRAVLARGTVRSWGRFRDGRPIAAASLLVAEGVAELAGLWTIAEERRRGHGRSVAAAALAGAGGRLVWAAAELPASAALLRGLGLRRVGTFERWELPG